MNLDELVTWCFMLLFWGVIFALLITLPQLVAAWAAASRRPAPRRVLAALGVWAMYYLLSTAGGESAVSVMVGLGMLAVAAPLWLLRFKGEGRLQFTLSGIFLIITGIALLLGLFVQPAFRNAPSILELIVLGSSFPATTLVAIGLACRCWPKHERAITLGAWLLGISILSGGLLQAQVNVGNILALTVILAWHALLVVSATVLWKRIQSRRAQYQQLLQQVKDRELALENISALSAQARMEPEINVDRA